MSFDDEEINALFAQESSPEPTNNPIDTTALEPSTASGRGPAMAGRVAYMRELIRKLRELD